MSEVWLALAVASLLMQFTPGPGFALVVSRSISEGTHSGLMVAMGVGTGVVVWSAVASLGLGTALEEAPGLYQGLSFAGGCYLLILAVRQLKSVAASSAKVSAVMLHPPPARRAFAGGALITLLNPQVLVFFVAFLPQFVPADNRTHIFVGGVVFALSGLPLLLAGAVVSGRAHRRASGHPRMTRAVGLLAGAGLIVLGGTALKSAIDG